MGAPADPSKYLWWLVSRASGIVALVLITATVLLGLTMSTKLLRRPGLSRILMRLHEHLAQVCFAAIGVHGLSLLGDPWLRPGVRGLLVPFAMSYRPLYTGLGIVAGYMAAVLGLSYYLRRRIGAKRWRKLHRATLLAWALAAVHALGAGSDGSTLWLRIAVFAPTVPIVYLTVVRILGARTAHPRGSTTAAAITARPTLAEEAS